MGLNLVLKVGAGGLSRFVLSENASVHFEVCAGSLSCKRVRLLALVCGVFCEFVTFPLVSWVRCGT